MGTTPRIGSKVYVATDARYLGRFTVEAHEADGTLIVRNDKKGRGRVHVSQCYTTAAEAKAPRFGGGGWNAAAALSRLA